MTFDLSITDFAIVDDHGSEHGLVLSEAIGQSHPEGSVTLLSMRDNHALVRGLLVDGVRGGRGQMSLKNSMTNWNWSRSRERSNL
jgi:DNA-binding NarL/FixJ family response regulator